MSFPPEDMRGDQYHAWKHFECQRCGQCCIELGLSSDGKSMREIAELLDLEMTQLIEKYYGRVTEVEKDRVSWVPEDHKKKPCPFLRADGDRKSCAVYSVRPDGCMAYPLYTDLGRVDVVCPAAIIVDKKLEDEEAKRRQESGGDWPDLGR